MRNSRTGLVVFGLCLFAAVLLTAAGLAEKSDDKNVLADVLSKFRGDLSDQNAIQMKVNHDFENLQSVIRKIQGTQSPIKVRGGSMTIFTTDAQKWQNGDGSPGHPFCSLVDNAANIRFDGDTVQGVTLPWTIQAHGTIPVSYDNFARYDPSPRGITLSGSQNDCNNQQGHNSVSLSYFGTGAGFYLDNLQPAANKKDNRRFSDGSQHCFGAPKATGEGDREICERMREVDSSQGITPAIQKPCLDGDCDLEVGNPIP